MVFDPTPAGVNMSQLESPIPLYFIVIYKKNDKYEANL